MSLQTFLFLIQTAFSMFYLHSLLLICCPWGVRQGWVLMVFWKASSNSSVSPSPWVSFFVYSTIYKTINDPSCGAASACPAWGHAHGWIYQASYSYPEKCRVTFGMRLIKTPKSEHQFWADRCSSFMQGFHICAHQLCLLFTKAQYVICF